MRSRGQSLFLALSLALIALPAAADVPPPDACTGAEGSACSNAGPNANQSGTCEKRMCTKGSPTGMVTTYECLQCVAGEASSKDDDDDGCNMGPVRTEHGIAGALVLVGLAALRFGRGRLKR